MTEINTEFICLIAEMRRLGNTPAPSKGGSLNNLLRYRETREKILDRFLDAFVAGYRLQMTGNAPTLTPPNEPLTLDELREMDGEPVWVKEVEHWALIDVEKGGQWDGIPFAVWAENGAKFTYNIEGRNLHCYLRPPEGDEDT